MLFFNPRTFLLLCCALVMAFGGSPGEPPPLDDHPIVRDVDSSDSSTAENSENLTATTEGTSSSTNSPKSPGTTEMTTLLSIEEPLQETTKSIVDTTTTASEEVFTTTDLFSRIVLTPYIGIGLLDHKPKGQKQNMPTKQNDNSSPGIKSCKSGFLVGICTLVVIFKYSNTWFSI